MAGNKYSSELLLQGKFEIDQNSLSVAAKFTQELVNIIERPLQEMSHRISSSIAKAVGGGRLVDQFGVPFQSADVGASAGSGATKPAPQIPQQGAPGSLGQAPTHLHSYMEQFRAPHDVGLAQKIMAERQTSESNIAMMYQKAKGAGVDLYSNLSEEQKRSWAKQAGNVDESIKQLVSSGVEVQKNFNEKIEVLRKDRSLMEAVSGAGGIQSPEGKKAFDQMSDTLKQTVKDFYTLSAEAQNDPRNQPLIKLTEELVALQKESNEKQDEFAGAIQVLKNQKSALMDPTLADEAQKAEIEQQKAMGVRRNIMGAMMAVQGVSQLGQFALDRPAALERASATRAGMERGESRALLSGDLERYALIRELGGQERLTSESMKESRLGLGLQSFGGIAGGIAGYLGAGSAATALGGAGAAGGAGVIASLMNPLGMLALGGGLAYGGYKAYQAINEPEEDARQRYEERLASRAEQSRELRMGMGMSRSRLSQAFQTSRALGDTGLESLIYGSGVGRGPSMQDLNTYAAGLGVDYSQIGAPLAGAFGSKVTPDLAKQAVDLSTRGISPDILSQFGVGASSQDPRETFSRVKDLYAEAMSSGIEKSQLPRAMERVASVAASSGLGGAAEVSASFKAAASMAGSTFGPGYNAQQLSTAQKVEQMIFGTGGTFGGGGMGGAGRILGASDVMQKKIVGGKSLQDVLGDKSGIFTEMLTKGPVGSEKEFIEGLKGIDPNMSEDMARQFYKGLGGSEGISKTISGGALKLPEEARMFQAQMEAGSFTEAVKSRQLSSDESVRRGISARARTGAGEGLGAEAVTTPGGVLTTSQLATEATALAEALNATVKALPEFKTAVEAASSGIRKAMEGLEEKNMARKIFDRVMGND